MAAMYVDLKTSSIELTMSSSADWRSRETSLTNFLSAIYSMKNSTVTWLMISRVAKGLGSKRSNEQDVSVEMNERDKEPKD